MARGRMLNRSICVNEEIDAIISKIGFKAGLFITWMIPHLDVEGRMIGNPAAVRAAVVPLRIEDFPVDSVEQILQEANDQGILKWYTVDGKQFIWFPKFAVNQVGLRKDREPASAIPPSPGEDPDCLRQPSGKDPDDYRNNSGSDPEGIRLNRNRNRNRNRREEESESQSEENGGGADGAPPLPAEEPLRSAEIARRDLMPNASPKVLAAMVMECPAVDAVEEIRRAMTWVEEHPNRTPKNWSAFLRKWFRRSDGRPEGGNNGNGESKPSGPPPKPEPSRCEKDAANAKLMEEQRKRLGF